MVNELRFTGFVPYFFKNLDELPGVVTNLYANLNCYSVLKVRKVSTISFFFKQNCDIGDFSNILSDGGADGEVHSRRLCKNSSAFGRPLEEVDPFIFEDTFCILTTKFSKHYIFRFTANRSLFLFGPLNHIRQISLYLVTHPLYDLFIISVIFANCFALAFDSNVLVRESEEVSFMVLESSLPRPVEVAFLAIYTVEMTLKIIAKGLVMDKFSYLRNGWNILDFVIVVSGLGTELIDAVLEDFNQSGALDLEVFRTFRVLRAVKTFSILPGLHLMINALMNSVVQLLEVMALTFFCLCIFALFATQLYMGRLRQTCVLIKGSETSRDIYKLPTLVPIEEDSVEKHKDYSDWVHNEFNWLRREFPLDEFAPCTNESDGRQCPEDYICLPNLKNNHDDGWTSFDNFLISLLATFQLLTLDFWERLYELIMSTVGVWSIPFFTMVVFLGSFYLLNLMLAVVAMSYEIESHSWEKKPLTKHQMLTVHRTDSTFSFTEPARLNLTVMSSYKRRTPADRERLARNLRSSSAGREDAARAHEAFTTAIMDVLGRRMNAPQDQPYQAVVPPPPPVFGIGSPKATAKPVVEPTRERDQVLNMSRLLADISYVKSVERLSEQLVSRKKSEKVFKTKAEEDNFRSAEYNSDNSSGTAVSVLSTEFIEDPDQYTTTPSNHQNEKGRAKQRSVNIFIKMVQLLNRTFAPYVNSWVFEAFITICILLNTILLACEHHGQPEWLAETINLGGYVFTLIFTFECILKITVLHTDYFRQRWNLFDLAVVCASIADFMIDSDLPGGNAVRSLRLLRIFKLAHSWITMKILLGIIFSTFGALGNLVLILAIVIYIFAILGMQVVGKGYIPTNFDTTELDDEKFPRWNFQNFWYSFMMVFRVLCGEWIEPLWDCLMAHKHDGEWKCFIIFLPILIIGNFIVLNLFLALLLNSFDSEQISAQREKEIESSERTETLRNVVELLMRRRPSPVEIEENPEPVVEDVDDDDDDDNETRKPKVMTGKFKITGTRVVVQNRVKAAERAILRADGTNEYAEARFQKNPLLTAKRSSFIAGQKTPSEESVVIRIRVPDPCFPKSCDQCLALILRRAKFKSWMCCRKFCLSIVTASIFEWGILLLIAGSSITLTFEDINLEQNADLKYTLFILNNSFTAVFVLEMLLKWMGLGLQHYFTSFWTLLDFFIVLVSVVSLAFDIENESWKVDQGRRNIAGLGALKALRTLRALRPLRAISRWQGMKVVVNALVYAIPSIVNVLLVCLLFWLVFAIMGVQFFRGRFFSCVYDINGSEVHHTIVDTKDQCCARDDMSWINANPNFDNVLQGYLSLFQVATFEGWIELMHATTDSNPYDMNHNAVRDQSFANYAFYVTFIVLGSFFTLNLFTGVIIDNFNKLKKKYEGNFLEVLLTPNQKRYYTAMKKLGSKKPRKVIRRPLNPFYAIFYDIALSRRFEIAVFALIFLNMVVMSVEHSDQRPMVAHAISGFNFFFSAMYMLECVLKIAGMKHYYFTVPWNVFDFCLVFLSLLDIFFVDSGLRLPFPPTLLRVARVFRVGRVLRLIKAAKGIRKLLLALIVSLPALFNIGALLALINFIYAILGMALFKDAVPFDAIDDIFSFQTFGQSSLMLFRLMTAAGWNEVLDALNIEEPVCGRWRKMICGREGEPECVSGVQSVIFMISYLIISYLIIINMYIAIILENFDEANRDEEIGIVEDDLEMFYIRWSRFDPTASQFLPFDQLSEFLNSLDPPLDIPIPNVVAIVAFNLPIARGNKIHCLDILHAIIKHVLGHVDDSDEFRKLQEQMESKFRKQFPSRKLLDIVSSTRVWKIQHNAALIIQKAWKAYRIAKFPPKTKVKFMQRWKTKQPSKGHAPVMNLLTGVGQKLQHKQKIGISPTSGSVHPASFKPRQGTPAPGGNVQPPGKRPEKSQTPGK